LFSLRIYVGQVNLCRLTPITSSKCRYDGTEMQTLLPDSTSALVTAPTTYVFPIPVGPCPTKATPFLWRASNIGYIISFCS
ncbi:MAG: hypothetical protein ACRDF4_06735, partial [Rhabdochlamydiaceae bacterium]